MLDYHIHTKRCHHAVGEMEDYVRQAFEMGLKEIGFADHFPLDLLDYIPKNQVTMAKEELDAYIEDVLALAAKHTKLNIRLGVEVDYLPGKEETIRRLLAAYPFDYVIGSVHFLEGWDFTHPAQAKRFEEISVLSAYEEYFALIKKVISSQLFDIIGHIDIVKKFGYHVAGDANTRLVAEVVRVLKEADVCVEVNTSGWRAPVGEQYPARAFLEDCFSQGIPVTLGSDAHTPHDVGGGLVRAVELLRDVGYTRIARFARRKRYFINL